MMYHLFLDTFWKVVKTVKTSDTKSLLFTLGQPGFDGNECPVSCPTKCDGDDMHCYGGSDFNGCANGDFCMPSKGKCVIIFKYLFQIMLG